jgi:GTP cyclohydrolase I
MARRIPFLTVCEHHSLPFSRVAHIGYGVRAVGAVTVTSALLGDLRTDPRAGSEFLALTGVRD